MSTTVTVEEVELRRIFPSATNPRKSFDQEALDQLVGSIKVHGVTFPILVRPKMDEFGNVDLDDEQEYQYELVSGHRRLRAAELAGLETIPCYVRELDDAEALDIQMVENLQRADLHPLDEAAGYKALIDAAAERGVSLVQEELAHRVGKPLSYVAQRLKLLDLAETPREVFQAGHINLGHALLLARLTPDLQDQGLRAIFDAHGQYSGSGKKAKSTQEVVEISLKAAETSHSGPREAARPATEFKNWIRQNVELDLEQAPWDLGDEELIPEAGSCVGCAKRSGNNPALFAELMSGEEKCTDPTCFDLKAKTFVQIKLQATVNGKPLLNLSNSHSYAPLDGAEKKIKYGQWVDAKEKECPDARPGVLSDGGDMGKIKTVCINQKCKKHKHHVDTPREDAPKKSMAKVSPAEKDAAEEKQRIAQKRREAERMALYMAVREVASKVDRDTILLDYVANTIDREATCDPEILFKLNGWKIPEGRWQAQLNMLQAKVRTLKGTEFSAYIFDMMYGHVAEWEQWSELDHNDTLQELYEKYELDQEVVLAKLKVDRPELYPQEVKEPEKAKKGAKAKNTTLSAEGRKRVAEAIRKNVAERMAKRSGKDASAGDYDDDDLPDFDAVDGDQE